MRVRSIELVEVRLPRHNPPPGVTARSWATDAEIATPMSRYSKAKRHRDSWLPKWQSGWVRVTAEDGTWGIATVAHAHVVAPVIEHLATHIVGEDCLAIERIADMMFRLTKPYGSTGLASYAVSGIDLALWDLKGKLLGQPVYSLMGGSQGERIQCYASGNDVQWYMELGFRAFKVACPYGPADGFDGIKRNEDFVASIRSTVGDDSDLMLDCWMALDVEYAVRLAEVLRPYRLRWLEECLIPEDFPSYAALRRRLPWQGLATGEHWYTPFPFQWAIENRVVDILQPDVNWAGGLTCCRMVAAAVEAGGLSVVLHCGGNSAYGQHFTYASPVSPLCEFIVRTPPGVQLEDTHRVPGLQVPQDGYVVPTDAPGFGLDILDAWVTPI